MPGSATCPRAASLLRQRPQPPAPHLTGGSPLPAASCSEPASAVLLARLGALTRSLRADRSTFSQEGGDHQPQRFTITAGCLPAGQPLLQLLADPSIAAKSLQKGAGVIETRAPITEAIQPRIQGRLQQIQIGGGERRQGIVHQAPRNRGRA